MAVLGGGIDVIYPRENADLYDRLVEGGALVANPRRHPTAGA